MNFFIARSFGVALLQQRELKVEVEVEVEVQVEVAR